tara:strand:- start:929 stop:1096 length:168 start_codon:yes stop_codon:yes gene_type:complete
VLGASLPLIFSVHATFSGALTKRKSDLFFLRCFEILFNLEFLLSPTIFLLKWKNG